MVHFVGAGCGAPDLITVRGLRLIEQADMIIYAGSLINPDILQSAKHGVTLHDSARLTLEEVLDLIKEAHSRHPDIGIVRLHSGEISLYSSIREQIDALDMLGIAWDITPGVSAAFGAAASLGIEYTLPGVSQSLIITRMEGRTPVPERENIASMASHGCSMAIYLSSGLTLQLQEALLSGGCPGDTPVAIVYKASWPEEKIIFCSVDTLNSCAVENGIKNTAVILIGKAVGIAAESLMSADSSDNAASTQSSTTESTSTHSRPCDYDRSRLYSPDFSTGFRERK